MVAEGVDVENKFGLVLERVQKLGSQVRMALPSVKHALRDSEPATRGTGVSRRRPSNMAADQALKMGRRVERSGQTNTQSLDPS